MAQSVMDPVRGPTLRRSNEPPAVVPLVAPYRRRPSWVMLGALLVGLSALLGAWVFSSTSTRIAVVVAARDIEPGEVLAASDLRVIEVGAAGEMRTIHGSQQSLVIGRAARGPIPSGTVLNTDLFTDPGGAVPAGFVVVGASLEAGAAPTSGLSAGDPVDVLGVAKGAASDTAVTASVITRGSVWAVERPTGSSSSSRTWVSLLVPAETQTAVAQAAADGRLRLSLVGVAG